MRSRPSSRLLVFDPADRVLLFRFVYRQGALAGQSFWATPGGEVDVGETFEQAAIRELHEETGIEIDSVGGQVARREFVLEMHDGEHVLADERFFAIQVNANAVSDTLWTDLEKQVMTEHHWWSQDELARTSDPVFPANILEIIRGLSAF